MNIDHPLFRIERHWQSYRDSIGIVESLRNLVKNGTSSPIRFMFSTEDEFDKWYNNYLIYLREYLIVLLWAEFDQIIINYLNTDIRNFMKEEPRLRYMFKNEKPNVGTWNTEIRLDFLKNVIKKTGELKQVYRYRNYIVHRNPKYHYSLLPPETVYERIKKAVIALYPNQPIPDSLFE